MHVLYIQHNKLVCQIMELFSTVFQPFFYHWLKNSLSIAEWLGRFSPIKLISKFAKYINFGTFVKLLPKIMKTLMKH